MSLLRVLLYYTSWFKIFSKVSIKKPVPSHKNSILLLLFFTYLLSCSGFFENFSVKPPVLCKSTCLNILICINTPRVWRSTNLPNQNVTLFQTFNVTSLKIATVMEFVMVQQNANAMTIGNQKQTALVTILNWIWLDYSLFCVKWNKTLSEFVCKDNVDCNGKGSCKDSKCDCLPRWDSFADCHGEYCIKIVWKTLYLVITNFWNTTLQ